MRKRILYILIITVMLMITNSIKTFAVTGTVTTETLNLREQASTESNILALINQNDKLEVISKEGDWYKVKYGTTTGYVSKQYITLDGELEENSDNDIIQEPDENKANNIGQEPENKTNNENELQTTTVSEPTTEAGVKINSNTKIYILPAINSNVLQVTQNTIGVEVITKTNKWAFIQTEEITGWVPLNVLEEGKNNSEVTGEKPTVQEPEPEVPSEGEPQEPEEPTTPEEPSTGTTYENSKTMYVTASSIYVRSEPSTSGDIVTSLIKNTDVKVLGEDGDWYKVKYNNFEGYIRKDLLSETKESTTSRANVDRDYEETTQIEQNGVQNTSKGNEVAEYAKQYLGCPYVYGASGASSFDCSGFTMFVYEHFGYSLPHSATRQANYGTYVAKEELQPGDLVFFLDYETMDGIGHCGIYIGDGNFIHASSGSGYCVKISTLLSGSYYNRYETARRLL